MNKIKVYFFFPSFELGGVPILFSRIVNSIVDHLQIDNIYVIDFENGCLHQNIIKHRNIVFIKFLKGNKVIIPDDAVIVLQSTLPYRLPEELKISAQTRLIFWNLHPDNLIPIIPLPYFKKIQLENVFIYNILSFLFLKNVVSQLKEFILLINKKKALLLMDEVNKVKIETYFKIKLSNYIYLPVPVPSTSKKINLADLDKLTFCWVGRLCDFKSYILIYTLTKFSEIAFRLKLKMEYLVIGVGDFFDTIHKLKLNNSFFEFKLLKGINSKDLDDFLLNNVNILTAMGTSALEGAKLGIPTILLDFSYQKILGDYKFRWLHDTKNYDLGHNISKNDYQTGNKSLENMLEEVKTNYITLSEKSLEYFNNNHSLENIKDKFIECIENTSLEFNEINPEIFKKSIPRKIYEYFKNY
ncbi:MAG: hypothetical protein MUF43_02950 [Flavobacterium sp.]|nr:hypothetical protein [Flavobacterium sp.]